MVLLPMASTLAEQMGLGSGWTGALNDPIQQAEKQKQRERRKQTHDYKQKRS